MDEKRVAYLKHEARIEADEYNRKKSDEAARIAALEAELEAAAEALSDTQGEWAGVSKAYAPEWTHPLKDAEDSARALLEDK